jgi:hypothetical protein
VPSQRLDTPLRRFYEFLGRWLAGYANWRRDSELGHSSLARDPQGEREHRRRAALPVTSSRSSQASEFHGPARFQEIARITSVVLEIRR